jgi:hypothetical protein
MLLFSIPHAMVFPVANFLAFRSVEPGEVVNASYAFQASSGVAEILSPALAVVLIPFVGVGGVFLVGAAVAGAAFLAAASKPDDPWAPLSRTGPA